MLHNFGIGLGSVVGFIIGLVIVILWLARRVLLRHVWRLRILGIAHTVTNCVLVWFFVLLGC